jgi:hypothetical protein
MNLQELEESISRLESVDAVRIVGDGSRVSEVHILAAPSKPPKQVVRDVQSLAMARYGANIDRRVISVVQLAADALRNRTLERPALVGIREEPEGNRNTVKVTLAWQNGDHTGSATGPAVPSAKLRLIGEATLDALDGIFVNPPPLALDSIGPAAVGMRTVLIAVVVGVTEQEELSVGSALSHGDDGDAAVRAVLDALNRRLPALLESD